MEFIECVGRNLRHLTDYRNFASLFPEILSDPKFYHSFLFAVDEGWRKNVIFKGKVAEEEFIKGYFSYINSLNRLYKTTPKNINSVTFDVSRYGAHNAVIDFAEPVSEKIAITAAEAYLTRPMTQEQFDLVRDDVFPGTEGLQFFVDGLGNAKFL